MITDECIKFGRWLLKNASEGYVNHMLCWKYNNEFYNTDELYEIYIKLAL